MKAFNQVSEKASRKWLKMATLGQLHTENRSYKKIKEKDNASQKKELKQKIKKNNLKIIKYLIKNIC